MINIYCKLWVDAIVNSKGYKDNEDGWKSNLFWLITTANVLNVMFVYMWLNFFQIFKLKYLFNSSTNLVSSSLVEIFIMYYLPIVVINYFLIFRKDRYKKLIIKYSHYNGKLALYYGLGSLAIIVISVVIMW
jgi:hypothetical protein